MIWSLGRETVDPKNMELHVKCGPGKVSICMPAKMKMHWNGSLKNTENEKLEFIH
jgi:hypothetical protein